MGEEKEKEEEGEVGVGEEGVFFFFFLTVRRCQPNSRVQEMQGLPGREKELRHPAL